jgi:hypothetical protein
LRERETRYVGRPERYVSGENGKCKIRILTIGRTFFKWIWSYVHGAVGIYVEREKRERGDEREKEKELSLSS